MTLRFTPFLALMLPLFFAACGGGSGGGVDSTSGYVADYRVATDSALRAIPDSYINTARTTLHVAYNHTSHGTHVSYGAYGLPDFKSGDSTKFAVTSNTAPEAGKLDIQDNQMHLSRSIASGCRLGYVGQ